MAGETIMELYLGAFGSAFFFGLALSAGKTFLRKITL